MGWNENLGMLADLDPQYSGDVLEVGSTNDLLKALQANDGVTDIAALVGGSALQKQSLEGTLASITIREELMRFWKRVPKDKAFSTLEEASILQDVGEEAGAVGQMENPPQGDAQMKREFIFMKYLRTHARVSDVENIVTKVASAEAVQNQAGILRIIRLVERMSFFGDASQIPQEFSGLKKQIVDGGGTQVDLAGADVTAASFREGARAIADAFGRANIAFLSNGAQTRIDSALEAQSAAVPGITRINQMDAGKTPGSGEFALGFSVNGVKTSFGFIEFEPDVFLNTESQGVPTPYINGVRVEGATSSLAPNTPTFILTVVAPVVVGSQWTAGQAGSYNYRVTAVNQYGKSAAAVAQAATVAASGAINVTITDTGGVSPSLAYEIYRETAVGSASIVFMTRVVRVGGGATYQDLNAEKSGTSSIFLLDMNTMGGDALRTMYFKQLAPIHKTPLAKVGPFVQWLINLYGALFLYAPQKQVLMKNVKSR